MVVSKLQHRDLSGIYSNLLKGYTFHLREKLLWRWKFRREEKEKHEDECDRNERNMKVPWKWESEAKMKVREKWKSFEDEGSHPSSSKQFTAYSEEKRLFSRNVQKCSESSFLPWQHNDQNYFILKNINDLFSNYTNLSVNLSQFLLELCNN